MLYTFLFTRVLGMGAESRWRFREKSNETGSEVFNKMPENGMFSDCSKFGVKLVLNSIKAESPTLVSLSF